MTLELLVRLGKYMMSNDPEWTQAKAQAERQNGWFTSNFINESVEAIASEYLNEEKLMSFSNFFRGTTSPKRVGIIMAGNIPLVGFHDFLCVLISGHHQCVKLSSKDEVLMTHLIAKLVEWQPEIANMVSVQNMLKDCDAYIATGSQTSSIYFKQYFGKYPHIIRKNKTSVAILDESETAGQLDLLAEDIYQFFGLGCRNVTKLYVPHHYDFIPLLAAGQRFDFMKDHNKYRNNYDYNLALYILNNQFYMTNDRVLIVENTSLYSPISVLHYEYYDAKSEVLQSLKSHDDVQAIVSKEYIPFGHSQKPALTDFADGVNTVEFLNSL